MLAKKWLKDYFTFSRRDRIGIIALVILIVIIYLLPVLFKKKRSSSLVPSDVVARALDTLELRKNTRSGTKNSGEWQDEASDFQYEPSQQKSFVPGELFPFDPNTLPVAGWQRLGLSEKTSKTIDKYRSKGGKFYKPEDLQRIWGLPGGFYERVKDYIKISSTRQEHPQNDARPDYYKPQRKVLVVDINEADTGAFIALPGIGSKLAARIVGFREKLGGFYTVEQISETYGLQDSVFQKIRNMLQLEGGVKKFNLNTVTKDELKAHPYFRWNLANAIVEYRNQHGSFKSLEELKKIAVIDDTTFGRIVHYLDL